MITTDLTDAEIHSGMLRVYYPPEDRMLYVLPLEILSHRYLAAIFELTPSEERILRDKAAKLEQRLIELGR